ncbi:MAG: hypothetical protein V1658_03445 [Candidatus Micrarchaeota archaeon]
MGIIRWPALGMFIILAMGCVGPSPSPAPTMPASTATDQARVTPTLAGTVLPAPTATEMPTFTIPVDQQCMDGSNCRPAPSQAAVNPASPTVQQAIIPAPEALALENYDGKFFTIRKPAGWEIATGGSCSTFSFVMKDKMMPQRQIFYFGEIGPVYLDESQKLLDRQYMDMGGFQIFWYEMPVVKPLTPENFLESEYLLMKTSLLKQFMADLPELNEVEIIYSESAKSPVAGDTKLMRALFKTQGGLGEGQFFLTTREVLPLSGFASGGIGYGFTFIGIAAEKKEFKYLEKTLTESINSFTMSQEYVSNCLQQQKTTEGILKAGKTLSETSDIIMSSWESRNRADDIISEKRSDAILGRERVYNPDTGTVYDVNNGFYDDYDSERQNFDMSRLEMLPENDWNLWNAPAEDGSKIH